jgi:hypothetical protein
MLKNLDYYGSLKLHKFFHVNDFIIVITCEFMLMCKFAKKVIFL